MRIKFLISVIIAVLLMVACKKADENIDNSTSMGQHDFEKGMEYFNDGKYDIAKDRFLRVDSADPNFNIAQQKIKRCDELLEGELDNIREETSIRQKQQKEEDLKKQKYYKKYDRMFGGDGWLHEKQSKLLSQGFTQYESGYESAPDGSDQIAFYYSKEEDGYTIHVRLQYSYSMDHHYARVWVK